MDGLSVQISPLFPWAVENKNASVSVISVGNITVGGTGKTPCDGLSKGVDGQKNPVAILSRGYKRTKTSEPVVSDGKNLFLSPKSRGMNPF